MNSQGDAAAARHRIVLVGDPDWDSRAILARALDHAGYDVRVADSGDRLLAVARESHPDLVIAEIYVRCASGPCTVQCMKRDAALRQIPVLVYTSRVLPADEQWARDAGAERYLRKPAPLETLLGAVAEMLPGEESRQRRVAEPGPRAPEAGPRA